ncbi:MAG: Fic family protein [Bacteroidales bacterium]|jgi:hypothetical protein|nr:Fic family protein [Bacteroidales bacterium]
MALIQQKLANSLLALKKLQNKEGIAVVRFSGISKVHLGMLVKYGFLQEVMRGWYISSRPNRIDGDTTNWYASYWYFIAEYAKSRFGKKWCLSAEQSLFCYGGSRAVPKQVIIRSPLGSNNIAMLMHDTSLFNLRAPVADRIYREPQFKLNLYSLEEALVECNPDFFNTNSIIARTCLSMVTEVSGLLKILLNKGRTTKAGRLAGAFRNLGNTSAADEIMDTMKRLGYDVREEDPFLDKSIIPYSRSVSPYVLRINLMWEKMREVVMDNFPKTRSINDNVEECLDKIDAQYKLDAYHSLSIEGYKVTDELIEKVRQGHWRPDRDISDAEQQNAMAARGYWQAFQAVKKSVKKILTGSSPSNVVKSDHSVWYSELFAPSVAVGLLKQSDLAGYRSNQVYIHGSMHTPLNVEAVREVMPAFFELLKNESDARVRAVLGHFIFVYIHPYMDGNGRMARFLMNSMLISGGYSWMIIPVEKRQVYMAALEKANVENDITDFTKFLASLLKTRKR